MIGIVEINADNRIATCVMFDLDEIDAAFAELEDRYLAGEASVYAQTWSVIAGSFKTANEHELPRVTPDWVSIDHRRVAITLRPGDLLSYARATWDDSSDAKVYIESVHRLDRLGAVVTYAANGTSTLGFEAEWREVALSTFDGELINRCELYEFADLDAALTNFDELDQATTPLSNTASRVVERYGLSFVARDWAAMAETLADGVVYDDRRRVVNAGVRHGRDVHMADDRAAAEIGAEYVTFDVIAIRGERLALSCVRIINRNTSPGEVAAQILGIAEIDVTNQIAAIVIFDEDDIDGALQELDARYLAGEAAPYERTWSVVLSGYRAFHRHELPATTPGWVNIDHRRVTTMAAGKLLETTSATWDITSDTKIYVEGVHRLNNSGAVLTHVANGTSREGFEAKWRVVDLVMVGGDLSCRCEMYDEADLDAALARFDELSCPAPRLENTATRIYDIFEVRFRTQNWNEIANMLSAEHYNDDRRRVIGAGLRRGSGCRDGGATHCGGRVRRNEDDVDRRYGPR